MKPGQLIELLENPKAPQPLERDEHTEILLTLLVHMFFADRRLDDREVSLLTRILPEGQDAQPYIEELSKRELDLDRLAALFPDPKDRDDIITLAEHAVWGDDEVDPREWDFVDKLVEKLGVSRD
ncbi:MAG: Tellurite resistance protein TerB [Myxococcaceae bacterium]|nr:Tellurite resistance protein TerB [Myxococcaceae bacterium]